MNKKKHVEFKLIEEAMYDWLETLKKYGEYNFAIRTHCRYMTEYLSFCNQVDINPLCQKSAKSFQAHKENCHTSNHWYIRNTLSRFFEFCVSIGLANKSIFYPDIDGWDGDMTWV